MGRSSPLDFMEVSPEHVQNFKEIWKKEYNQELTDLEAKEYSQRLLDYMKLVWEIAVKEEKRKERLKREPKGFHLSGVGFTCCICYDSISNEETWYDAAGIKCLLCQRALDKKVIPKSVCKKRDSWYATWELQSKFGIHYQTAMKMVRNGELNGRMVENDKGEPHYWVFLKKENYNL